MIEKNSLELKKQKTLDPRPVLSFLLTAVFMLLIFATQSVAPLGTKSFLVSDLAAQYAPALASFKDAVTRGGFGSFSFSLGMGKNPWGFIGYYLSSPINLIVLLFPKAKMSEAIVVMILLKLSFASAFMTWLLDRKFSDKSKMTVIFGASYALCSYTMIFMFNFMWLDGFAILPLLICVMEMFRENRRNWGFVVLVLALLFISGYYIAYMAGVFSFIYLLATMAYEGKLSTKDDAKTVMLYIAAAVCAAMICAFLLLPAGLDTIGNGDNSSALSISLMPNFRIIDFVPNLFLVSLKDLTTNLPYVSCNLTVLILNILLFLNQDIPAKLKRCMAVVWFSFLLSFMLPPLNLLWHLLNEPNWFLYRYSFLMSFVMVLAAFYSFQRIRKLAPKHFVICGAVLFGLLVLGEGFASTNEGGSPVFFQTVIFSAMILAFLFGLTKETWPQSIRNLQKWGCGLLVLVMTVEMVFLSPKLTLGSVVSMVQEESEFEAECTELIDITSALDKSSFYRTESGRILGKNLEPEAVYGYADVNTISFFSSMANKQQQHFLKQLGYKLDFNYTGMEHVNCILPADSLMGIRYIVTTDGQMYGLDPLLKSSRYMLFENPYALPIAYLASSDADTFDGYSLEKATKEKHYFDFQEALYTSLTNEDASDIYEVFTSDWEIINGQKSILPPKGEVPSDNIKKDGLNLEIPSACSKYVQYYLRNSEQGQLILRTTIEVEEESPLYFCIPFAMRTCPLAIYVNGKAVYEEASQSYYSVICDLGSYEAGTKLEVEIRSVEDSFACFEPEFAYCRTEALKKQTDLLNHTVTDISVTNGKVSMKASAEEEKLLLTTIPYEKGWTVKVDGQPSAVTVYQDAFVAVRLPGGTHTVELTYTPQGGAIGVIISAAGVVLALAGALLLGRKKTPKQGVKD